MASALEFARRIANPPTTSFASVKGPSVTVNFPLELRTRAPRALGRQPSVANSQPALKPSSTSLPILAISSCEGGAFLSADLYMLRNFILSSPCFEFGTAPCKVDTPRHFFSKRLQGHDPLRCLDCACISENPAAAALTSAGKSENSCTWRTSITSLSEAGHRLAHSSASSLDFT